MDNRSKKIKIFVDAHVFDEVFQGTTTYLKGLYNSLINDTDFEITLGAHDIEALKKKFADAHFKFIRLPSRSKFKRLVIDIPSILKAKNFDYAHFQYIIPIPFGKKSCKYVNTIHDLLFLDFPSYFPFSYRIVKGALFKLSALNSDLICTVSEYSKEALIKHYKINRNNIIITPNGIDDAPDTELIDVKRKHGISRYILFVSRFEPRKNHVGLLQSFLDLRLFEKGYHLILIGKRQDVKTHEFNKLYFELPTRIKSYIIFLENVGNNDLLNFYRLADLFVYPSFAEGFGIPPLEAAAANCKVLCSNKTAMKEFDFFGNYLFDPDDRGDLNSKILEALNDEYYPHQRIKNEIMERYNWDQSAKAFGSRLKDQL